MTVAHDAAASPFGFLALTAEIETRVVAALGLRPLALPPELARAEGRWKGGEARIETAAYTSAVDGPAPAPIRLARFARVTAPGVDIGNVLCLPAAEHPLPILGADLVSVRAAHGMVAADLSPTLPAGAERERQLAPLAALAGSHRQLPAGGELPAWCADWFSPWALYTRVGPDLAAPAADALRDRVRVFVQLALASAPRADLAEHVARVQDGYAAAHRTDDKGLGMLATMFGAAWAERYVAEVLFPPRAG